MRWAAYLRENPPFAFAAAVLASFAYLVFVNLDYAPFWGDEAIMADIARNLLAFGSPIVDDGRYVVSYGGIDPDSDGGMHTDLRFRYPQMTFYSTALGFLLFGESEIGARAISGIFSLAAAALFWGVLRVEFPARPRLAALWLLVVCLSPMLILYARSATYNAPALFFSVLTFRLYLSFCARPAVWRAVLLLAAATACFHYHYVIGASFVFALGVFHLCFRARAFDRRAWIIAVAAGAVYAAQAAWFAYLDPDTYSKPATELEEVSPLVIAARQLHLHFLAFNENAMLFWSVALWFVAWRLWLLFGGLRFPAGANKRARQRRQKNVENFWRHLRELREDKVFQYFVFAVMGVIAIALTTPQPSDRPWADVRYFIALAPFAAAPTAAFLDWLWAQSRPLCVLAALFLLTSNIAGWPFLKHRFNRDEIRWTLPAMAAEFHRDYPSALREAVNYLRKHAKEGDVVYSNIHTAGPRLAFYLGDRVLVGGVLSRKNSLPPALSLAGRDYLFREDITTGKIPPDWFLALGGASENRVATLFKGTTVYERVIGLTRFPAPTPGYRPEPVWHTPNSSHIPDTGPYKSALYRLMKNPPPAPGKERETPPVDSNSQ